MAMIWTESHAWLFGQAVERVLGKPDRGTMAFVRCLRPEVVESLAADARFAPQGWKVYRVADEESKTIRTITADVAVELRESKGEPTLLLVDTTRCGAGMDGIYSAAQEVDETSLFDQARRLAANEVTNNLSRKARLYAERAIKKARGFGQRLSLSPWTEFDFMVRIAAEGRRPGELLYLLGMWPVKQDDQADSEHELDVSRLFVDRLLGTAAAGMTPAQRIEALKLLDPSEEQLAALERFLRWAATKPLLSALAELRENTQLWINALRIEGAAQIIQSIELVPWQTSKQRIAKWSGLIPGAEVGEPPVLVLNPDADKTGDYSKLKFGGRLVRTTWKKVPSSTVS
jgi:DNA phosphorothioation-dependent restriction protein DptH